MSIRRHLPFSVLVAILRTNSRNRFTRLGKLPSAVIAVEMPVTATEDFSCRLPPQEMFVRSAECTPRKIFCNSDHGEHWTTHCWRRCSELSMQHAETVLCAVMNVARAFQAQSAGIQTRTQKGRRLAVCDSELPLSARACYGLQFCCSTVILGFFPPAVQMSIVFLCLSETFNTWLLTLHLYCPGKASGSHSWAREVPSCLPERWRCGAEVDLCFAGLSLRAGSLSWHLLPCRLPALLHPAPASQEWLSDSCGGPKILLSSDVQAPVCSWARGEDSSSRQAPFRAARWPQTQSEPGDLEFCGWSPRCLPPWWPAWLPVPWWSLPWGPHQLMGCPTERHRTNQGKTFVIQSKQQHD